MDGTTARTINDRIDRLDGKGDGNFKEIWPLYGSDTATSICLEKRGFTSECVDFYQALDQISALAARTPTGQAKINMSYVNTGNDFKPRQQYKVSFSGSSDEIYAYAICMELLHWYIMDDKDIGTSIQKLMEDPKHTGSHSAINDAMSGARISVDFPPGTLTVDPAVGPFTNNIYLRYQSCRI